MYKMFISILIISCLFILVKSFIPQISLISIKQENRNLQFKRGTIPFWCIILMNVFSPVLIIPPISRTKSIISSKNRRYLLLIYTVISLIYAVTEVIKLIVYKERPDFINRKMYLKETDNKTAQHLLSECSKSFPSGHTSSSFALFLVTPFILFREKVKPLRIFLSSLFVMLFGSFVAYTRIFDHKHDYIDILGGFLVTTFCSSFLIVIFTLNTHKH